MKTDHQNRISGDALAHAPIMHLMMQFSIPSMISLLGNAVYNMTDQVFIGHAVGMLGNAAASVAFPVVTLTIAFSQLVGIGTAANFNINMGKGQEEEAKQYIGTGIAIMSVIGMFIMCAVLVFKESILLAFGATTPVFPHAKLYLSITAFGIPFQLFANAGSHLVRADGSPLYSMGYTMVGTGLNIFLDWLFLFGFHWGIQGAALATVISQVAACSLCLRYFTHFRTFRIALKMLRFSRHYVADIVKLGSSNFLNHVVMMLVNILMNNTLTYYGQGSIYGSEIPLAVSGVVAKVNSILSAFTIGLAHGMQPILGFNMGAKNYARIKSTYKQALFAALIMNVMAFCLLQVFPRQIVSIFGSGGEAYFQFAERYMRIFLFMVFVFGIQVLSVNYFTGIGDVRRGVILSLSRQGFFLIPLMILLPQLFGLEGVLYAGPIADALACMLSGGLVSLHFRKLSQMQQEQ